MASLGALTTNTLEALASLKANPTTHAISQKYLAPLATAGAVAITYIAIASVFSSFLDIIPFLQYLFNLLLHYFVAGKKGRAWGVIYNSSTKEPVDLAIVRLFSSKSHNILETAVTDRNGRFSFQPDRGLYYLSVTKPSFAFPSKLVSGLTSDGKYGKLYFGGNFDIKQKKALDFTIPLDPTSATKINISFVDRVKSLLERLSAPLLFLGLIMALFVYWVNTDWFNGLVVVLYLLLILTKFFLMRSKSHPWGKVMNIDTGQTVPGVVLRIFDKKYNKLLETKVTDQKGRFSFMLPKGEYYIRVMSYSYKIAGKKRRLRNGYYGDNFSVEENKPVSLNIPLVRSRKTILPVAKPVASNKKSIFKKDSLFDYLEMQNKKVSDLMGEAKS